MIVYYHTRTYIFAVSYGYCSAVRRIDGSDFAPNFAGERLLGGVADYLASPVVPVERIVVGMHLKFQLKSGTLVTEPVESIETVSSLSIPPARRDSWPPNKKDEVRDIFPTLPEILDKGWADD